MYGIAARAVSRVWLGMGGQEIGVRGVPGSIPGGTTTFDGVNFKWDWEGKIAKKNVSWADCWMLDLHEVFSSG